MGVKCGLVHLRVPKVHLAAIFIVCLTVLFCFFPSPQPTSSQLRLVTILVAYSMEFLLQISIHLFKEFVSHLVYLLFTFFFLNIDVQEQGKFPL